MLFWTVISFLCRFVLSLRYRLEVRGMDTLSPERLKRGGGILFLPNHPAHMDPLMIMLLLWPKYRMRPLVIEYVYRQPWIRPLMKLVRALSIPNFETSINQMKIKKAEMAIGAIADGLRKGENFLLYPAGKLKSSGRELIGGSSGAHSLIEASPETNVVLIRTTGLWGSSFSRALLGKSPDLKKTIFHNLLVLLKNLIFFTPRRKLVIEIQGEPEDLPRGVARLDFNRYLEDWYNRYETKGGVVKDEPVTLVSYSFWREDLPEVYQPKKRKREAGVDISPEVRSKIIAEIQRIVERPDLEVRLEMNLAFDIGMDSLQIADLIAYIGSQFDIEELHPEDIVTVESVMELAEGARKSEPSIHQVVHVAWPEEKDRPPPLLPLGMTIPEAFLNACDRMGSFTMCGDDVVGVLSYKKFKRSVLVLTEEFRRHPAERIGVLLPASAAAFIVILAIQCAGKVPVMLNWTLGPKALDEMIKTAEIFSIISSWRFLERLSHVDFGAATDQILLLEDIREGLTLKMKLSGAWRSLFSAKTVLRSLGRLQGPDDYAVILFTSGTENTPKGVPLSHGNILANLRAGMQCMDLKNSDVLYGILPPFHSFGFSVAGLFALLGGLKIAFYPDPTDSFALAEGIARWKITMFCSAPSFLKGLFQAAKKEQLKTVRFFITGAEKTPQELYNRVQNLGSHAQLIEGYGITECAPILTIRRPNLPSKGVGHPLPDVEVCTIHPETLELLPEGKEGEICVRGPNVFNGYLGEVKSPFIEIHGKRWYRTGDLGYLDKENNLILSGRLKRFTKIGGEMISLGAVEEVLNQELIRQGRISEDLPSIAVCADERSDDKQPQLILFATLTLDKEDMNNILREKGMSRLVKISAVEEVPEIPMLGTGKTDYRKLLSNRK
jgi:long-chain-fatty-acid--[acyl-carrier-protein] ligase